MSDWYCKETWPSLEFLLHLTKAAIPVAHAVRRGLLRTHISLVLSRESTQLLISWLHGREATTDRRRENRVAGTYLPTAAINYQLASPLADTPSHQPRPSDRMCTTHLSDSRPLPWEYGRRIPPK